MRTKASDGRRTFTDLARRAQMAQCAAEALAEMGYADVSMAEIARRAGVAKSVVSYHFSDKEELMGEVLRTALATYAEFMAPLMAAAFERFRQAPGLPDRDGGLHRRAPEPAPGRHRDRLQRDVGRRAAAGRDHAPPGTGALG